MLQQNLLSQPHSFVSMMYSFPGGYVVNLYSLDADRDLAASGAAQSCISLGAVVFSR
jgi:hypothetical protein